MSTSSNFRAAAENQVLCQQAYSHHTEVDIQPEVCKLAKLNITDLSMFLGTPRNASAFSFAGWDQTAFKTHLGRMWQDLCFMF